MWGEREGRRTDILADPFEPKWALLPATTYAIPSSLDLVFANQTDANKKELLGANTTLTMC